MFNSTKPMRKRAVTTLGAIALIGTTGAGMASSANAATASDASTTLAKIKQCESGGNYTAVNSSSGASGAYQFLDSTWRSMSAAAGYSTAASAPASVQDAAALELYTKMGTSPWAASSSCWSSASASTGSTSTTTGSTAPTSTDATNSASNATAADSTTTNAGTSNTASSSASAPTTKAQQPSGAAAAKHGDAKAGHAVKGMRDAGKRQFQVKPGAKPVHTVKAHQAKQAKHDKQGHKEVRKAKPTKQATIAKPQFKAGMNVLAKAA